MSSGPVWQPATGRSTQKGMEQDARPGYKRHIHLYLGKAARGWGYLSLPQATPPPAAGWRRGPWNVTRRLLQKEGQEQELWLRSESSGSPGNTQMSVCL